MIEASSLRDRFRGALLGLAVGDAVGTTVEFSKRGTFEPVTDMMGGGPFKLKPGQWTDDTSMAMCLAESLVEHGGHDPVDQMERYLRWYRDGYWSSTGHCFDIGCTVRAALERFARDPERNPYAGSTDPNTAGNGSLMRLAPTVLFHARDARTAIAAAADSSRTTHGAPAAVDACRYFAGLLVGCFEGASREELLSPRYAPPGVEWSERPLVPEIDEVAAGSYLRKTEPGLQASGYVVQTLEAALWAFANSTDFRQGCLLAVNLGDDADTTGAVYGQLAGAYYGAAGIPAHWRDRLTRGPDIVAVADRLLDIGAAA